MSSVASTTAQVSVLSSTTTTATSAIAIAATTVITTPLLITPDSNKSFNDHKNDDSIDDRQLNKQNTSNKTYTRGNSNKSKQLTRSHAMKESASPPRTPNSHSPTALTLTTDVNHDTLATIPSTSPTSALLAAPTFVLPLSDDASGASGKSQLDIEFPKLTPPKTKIWTTSAPQMSNRSNGRKSVSSDTSSNNNSLSEDNCESHNASNDKQHQRSMHSSNSNNQSNYCDSKDGDCDKSMSTNDNYSHDDLTLSPIVGQCKSPNFNDNNNNYNNNHSHSNQKSNNQYTVKGKPPLKNMGSSSSFDGGNNSSGFISRDSSSEQFVDQNGIDLVQFFKETLNKNAKDRTMLMKIERDMLQLSVDQTGRTFVKFPAMSSYNRMLVHRTAAYFGMEHNVDGTQQSVIASVSKDTRIPDIRFKTLIRDTFTEEPRKSILKRESHSFEDYLKSGLLTVHRGILSRKAKSFEEREEEYEKVRRRIFRNREMYGGHESMDEHEWQWFQSERSEMSSKLKVPHHRMLKMHSTSVDGRYGERNPSVSKSHSFGGYGGNNNNNNNNNHVPGANGATLMRDDSITSTKSAGPRLHKQDSTTTWRLSPSSSGYKTQSIRSDSVTPSPTGYGSDTPEQSITSPDSSVMWAVTDMANVPVGSLIIDPQTLQPMKNQDGSVYHFDPTNPPTNNNSNNNSNNRNALTGSRKKLDRQRSMSHKPSSRDSSINNNTNSNSNSDTEKSTNMHPNSNNSNNTNNVDYSIKNNQTDNCSTGDYEDNSCETSICSQEPFNTKEINENNASQIEMNSQSNSQNHLKPDEMMLPMLKHQATSPNLPLNELTCNDDEESLKTTTCIIQPIIEEEVCVEEIKKEESIIAITTTIAANPPPLPTPVQEIRFQTNHHYANVPVAVPAPAAIVPPQQPMPIMSYAPAPASYSLDPSAAVYNQSIPYQAPDGTLYVLSQQPLMYSYAPTETDMSSYMVPVYDQNAMQPRDANVTMMPVSYQQSPATASYNGTTLYQSPMVFSSEQFPNQPAPGTVAQYPMTYPMGYPMTYPVNGTPYQNYWPQPMTYFIPQAQPTAAPPTPNNHMIQSVTTSAHNTSTNTTTTGHRRTSQLAQQQQQQHQNSALQSFPSSVPLPLATASQADPNTPTNTPQATMYALPPSMYPNVLPYAAPTSFYQTLPHPQPNAIISSVIPAHSAHPTANSNGIVTGNLHHTYTPTGNFQATEVLTHFPFNQQTLTHANNTHMNQSASTPQSAPSTPLSLTTVPPNFNKNPPLFATPPIITATGTSTGSYIQHHHDNSTNTYEKRNGNGFGGPKKYINNNNNNNNNNNVVQMIHATTVTPTTTTVPPHATTKIGLNTRQNSYQMNGVTTVTSQGKTSFNNNNNNNYNSEDNNSSSLNNSSNNNSSNNYNSNRLKNNNNNNYQTTSQTISYQPKTFVPAAIKMQQQQSANNSGSNTNSSGNSPNSNETETKYQSAAAAVQPSRGPPRIPPSLDLKRNSNSNIINAHHHHHQQRSTPSTNSNESSNQSPNSITSYDHSRTYHYPQYQQATGPTSGHFYRGNSAGSTHHNSGNGGDSTPIPTCFPFNVHQNAGASTPMLDSCHHQLISAYNPMAAGMYVKWNGHSAFSFANPSSIALPNNRKSPSNDIRPPLTPLTGVYSTMMMPGGPRQLNPRTMHNNPNYKNNRTQR